MTMTLIDELTTQLVDKVRATSWQDEEKKHYLDVFNKRMNAALLQAIYDHAQPELKKKLEHLTDAFDLNQYFHALADAIEDEAVRPHLEETYIQKLKEELQHFPT